MLFVLIFRCFGIFFLVLHKVQGTKLIGKYSELQHLFYISQSKRKTEKACHCYIVWCEALFQKTLINLESNFRAAEHFFLSMLQDMLNMT